MGRIGTYWDERERPEYDSDGGVSGTSIEDFERHAMAKDEFGNFAPGWTVIVRNDGWVDGQIERYEDAAVYIADTGVTAHGGDVESIADQCAICGTVVTGSACDTPDCPGRSRAVN